MTFLPVVERELRVASRKRSTFWTRVAAALAAWIIGTGFYIIAELSKGAGGNLGRGLFVVLTWLCLGTTLSSGLFFSSDCLSEEKREGTIGFLFLTDLRGYDVVLGKLLASSLRCFYALLAVFPILGITLLMGGVTGAQFWKTALALINAMLLSLAAGLFVSALSRESQPALGGTLLLCLLLVAIGPVTDALRAWVEQSSFEPLFSLSSPGYLFVSADSWGKTPFWISLLINQLIIWLLLGLACVLLPRHWQDKAQQTSSLSQRWFHWWKFGSAARLFRLRRRLMAVNPVLWLACRERWQGIVLWIVTILTLAAVAKICLSKQSSGWWFAWNYLAGPVTLLLYLGIASQSARFLVESQRSGLFQVLLATPLSVRQIIQGQWQALVRMLALPLFLFLAAYFAGTLNQNQVWRGITRQTAATIPANTSKAAGAAASSPNTASVKAAAFTEWNSWLTLMITIGSALTVGANLAALAWFGMWMGLTSRSANIATLKTIAFVQIIPWFAVSFVSYIILALLAFASASSGMAARVPRLMMSFPLLISGLTTFFSVGKDIFFCLWSRHKLYSQLRERAVWLTTPARQEKG